ncbi:hypothetical protein [Dactylosporangium sp. CA-092794]|uniref:hypothetical protein n=1 Tax=Dactylosporangium sp. CA-092794 TaxID=3239929 RepID=UPI003D8B7762
MDLVRSVSDTGRALRDWLRIRDHGFAGGSDRDAFFSSLEARPILRWALQQRRASMDRDRALEILADAPDALKAEVEPDA